MTVRYNSFVVCSSNEKYLMSSERVKILYRLDLSSNDHRLYIYVGIPTRFQCYNTSMSIARRLIFRVGILYGKGFFNRIKTFARPVFYIPTKTSILFFSHTAYYHYECVMTLVNTKNIRVEWSLRPIHLWRAIYYSSSAAWVIRFCFCMYNLSKKIPRVHLVFNRNR